MYKPTMIAGISYAVPDTVITNDDLSKIVDTSDDWIRTRTGISERRVCSGEENANDLGIKAAQGAIEKAKINPEDIDIIIAAASVPHYAYPAAACIIQAAIGAKNATAFDINAACSGLLYAMKMAKSFIVSEMAKNVLIVACDANSKFSNWEDRTTCVLFGDGAGAMVIKESEDGKDDIIEIETASDGDKGMLITMPISGKNCSLVEPNRQEPMHVYMNGKEVYKYVITTVPESITRCVERAGYKVEDIDYLVSHQANLRIIEALAERLNYASNKVVTNIDKYGNTSAASIPIAICGAVAEGEMRLPCTAILTAFGAGMTYGTAIVRLRDGIC